MCVVLVGLAPLPGVCGAGVTAGLAPLPGVCVVLVSPAWWCVWCWYDELPGVCGAGMVRPSLAWCVWCWYEEHSCLLCVSPICPLLASKASSVNLAVQSNRVLVKLISGQLLASLYLLS